MLSLLLIGFLIGMRHAMEADHVAAVASLVNGNQTLGQALRQGGVWGLGHTLALFIFGSAVVFLDTAISEQLARVLETLVGIMLLLLGADVLRRLLRDKMHFHSHSHTAGEHHFHAHTHQGETRRQHAESAHDHNHPSGFPLRALFIGLMHGMAGSAAVILLALGAPGSILQGLSYILIFGIGSMLGMAILSVVISLPMRFSAQRLTWAHNGLQTLAGIASICLGGMLIIQNSAAI